VVRNVAVDLVLLQEVAGVDQVEKFADLAGLPHVAFAPTRRTGKGEFGNAMLCRSELGDVLDLPVPRSGLLGEPRGVLAATFDCDGRTVHAVDTHFGLLPGEAEAAARVVLGVVAERGGPLIVGGDLNRPSASAPCHRLLRAALVDCAVANGLLPEPTFPAPKPLVRLDYLYAREVEVRATTVIPSVASDHRPLLAELRLR
jgi:endonuclease/exonuclease/phosphatase family metal-dependent hydrolase